MFIKFLQHYNIIDYIQQKVNQLFVIHIQARMVARHTNCAPYLMFIVVVFDSNLADVDLHPLEKRIG